VSTITRYEKQSRAIAKLRASVKDAEAMLKAIEGARVQLSATAQNLDAVAGEFRGQITVIKERVAFLLSDLNKLHSMVGKATNPGDSK